MIRVVRDHAGITHRFESGANRNTRCGRLIGLADVFDGNDEIVDCMSCLVRSTRLTLMDLKQGVEVKILVRLLDKTGSPAGSAYPITFSLGRNVNEVVFDDLPVGVIVHGHQYEDDDGHVIFGNTKGCSEGWVRRREADQVMILAGGARVL